jgi:hypothetical protein
MSPTNITPNVNAHFFEINPFGDDSSRNGGTTISVNAQGILSGRNRNPSVDV